MTVMSSYDWEIAYDTIVFEDAWGSTLESVDPDVIFMHTSGNATYSNTFEAECLRMIQYLKGKCPLADIYIAASWHGGDKATAMRSACNSEDVSYIDLSSIKSLMNMMTTGNWYLGDDDEWYGTPLVVSGHPSDIGCCRQANVYLSAAGYDTIPIYYIDATNVAGKISLVADAWVAGGTVSLGVLDTSAFYAVTTVSGVEVNTIERTNELNANYSNYLTFTMPKEDVVVIEV